MYTDQEFKSLPKESLILPAGVLAVCFLAFLLQQGVDAVDFLTFTDTAPYSFIITLSGFMLKVAQENREQTSGLFWVHSLVTTGIAAFGGGFLAPLTVGHAPTPLLEESFFWVLVVSWYITHHVPYVSAFWARLTKEKPVHIVLCILFSIFKTQQIFGAVEIASAAIPMENLGPKARYFTVPWAAMLVCGFLGGCGGAFLPFSKGLAPIEEGKKWPVSAAFIAAVSLVYSTRYFGVDKLKAKLGICLFRILGEIFPEIRAQVLDLITPMAVKVTGVRHKPTKVVPVGP